MLNEHEASDPLVRILSPILAFPHDDVAPLIVHHATLVLETNPDHPLARRLSEVTPETLRQTRCLEELWKDNRVSRGCARALEETQILGEIVVFYGLLLMTVRVDGGYHRVFRRAACDLTKTRIGPHAPLSYAEATT